VTPSLFAAYPTPADLAAAPVTAVETLIKRTGFFRQKTKSIQGVARAVAEEHGGQVPPDMDVLTTLPGVGRKTANVILGTAFGKPAIFVDTHVRRLSNRLGLTVSDDPVVIEQDLQKLLPPRAWTAFAHRLIHHGRRGVLCTQAAMQRLCASPLVSADRGRGCGLSGVFPGISLTSDQAALRLRRCFRTRFRTVVELQGGWRCTPRSTRAHSTS
jgi:endonuclease-3